MHKGGVGAIFQQAAHQIGQQVAMRADRGVDPATALGFSQHDIVQAFTHAVQALELKAGIARQFEDRRHGLGVVGRKLRIDAVGIADQLLGIGNIADIGCGLGGKQRKARQAFDLRALDLAVPIGALHQTHHDLAIQPLGGGIEPVDHLPRPLAVSLHHHAKAVPSRKGRIGQHRLDHLHRQDQTVLLFCIDVHAHAGGLCGLRQFQHHRYQFAHHAGFLRHLIARMQRRQLDRDARIGLDRPLVTGPCDGGDGIGIFAGIAGGISGGHRRLTQHVIAVGKALRLALAGTVEGCVDGLPQNELAAHLFHGPPHGGADHRLSQTLDHTAQGAGDAWLVGIKHLAGQHQGPGRGVDQAGRGLAQMLTPVGGRDLVLDQRVDRQLVRHAQHGLGQTHQRHALARRKAIFGQKMFHQRGLCLAADPAHQIGALGRNALARRVVQRRLGHQPIKQRGFGTELCIKVETGKIGHLGLRHVYRPDYRINDGPCDQMSVTR